MTGQFWVSLCLVAVHRGLYPFKERKVARCGWLGGRGGSFLIIDGRDGFRFFRTALLQNRFLFHFVCQVLNHRAACDVIIPLDNRCHIKPNGVFYIVLMLISFMEEYGDIFVSILIAMF
ncbi:conserved hypothetical protein [Trichinella spiralis]|uniref:hypothetical protein n=1 Tax=Trichinella spiralis TaxID=6334 RepID=UPI0001EFD04E|nr:conserved hypothetical protein [Trichinella spiralis]